MLKNTVQAGMRKNILTLWSNDNETFEGIENIENGYKLIEYYKRDKYIKKELESVHKRVVDILGGLGFFTDDENSVTEKEYLAQKVVNMELLVFMLMKASGKEEFAFENIRCLLSNIQDVTPLNFDKEILYKTRTLFKNIFGISTYKDTLIFYEDMLQNNMRVFNVSADVIKANHNEDDTVDVEYTNFKLNDRNSLTAERIDLYEMIVKENSLYDYVLKYYQFPTTLDAKGEKNKNGGIDGSKKIFIDSKYNPSHGNSENRRLDRVIPSVALQNKHSFKFFEFIEKRIEEKNKIDASEITFDIASVAADLDSELGVTSWVDRISNIKFKKVVFSDCVIPELPFETGTVITLKEASHIVGMLGVGKSTFTTLLTFFCLKNGLQFILFDGRL